MRVHLQMLKTCYHKVMNVLFVISLIIALVASLKVITCNNAVHALLYMIAFFFSLAVMIYLYGAPFIAALEVIIYAGAIVTLFIFVVMMLNLKDQKKKSRIKLPLLPLILIIAIQVELVYLIFSGPVNVNEPVFTSPEDTGLALISNYMAAIELAGMLLLAGIIGAYHLGSEKKRNIHRYLSNTGDNE